MDSPPLTGYRWQLFAASILLTAWVSLLLFMAIAG
jgi:hypothetical protein